MRKQERKNADVGFIDLEKVYDRVKRKALWQVLRVYDVGIKLFGGIKNLYVDSLACVKVKGSKSERFRIDSGVSRCVSCPLCCSMYIWIE